MSRLSHVNSVLAEFGAGLGLSDLTLNADQRVSLKAGAAPVTLCYLTEPLELLRLYCSLGRVDEDDDAAVEYLMRTANHVWISSGVLVGLDPGGRTALAECALPVASLSAASLSETLRALLEAALPIRAGLESRDYSVESSTALAPEAEPAPAPSAMHGQVLRP